MSIDRKKLFEDKPKIKIYGKISSCPTSAAMELIGGKWKSVILIHLIEGKRRYNELRKEIAGITERSLSLQLKQLEKDDLISRKEFTKKPPLKVEYSLTDFGKSLSQILISIRDWGLYATETKGEFIRDEIDF